MKKSSMIRGLSLCVVLVGCLMSCSQPTISWRMEQMAAPAQMVSGDSIRIVYPVAVGGTVADSINRTVEQTLNLIVGLEPEPRGDLSQRIDSLLRERNYDTMIRHISYEMLVNGEVEEFGKVASVRLGSYVYLGGAHGLQMATFLNFDLNSGRKLDRLELFADTAALWTLNKEAFLRARGADLTDAVLFVAPDELPLPQNIAIDSAGVRMHYNPYEIAPYVFGPTDYLLPMDEVRSLLDPKISR